MALKREHRVVGRLRSTWLLLALAISGIGTLTGVAYVLGMQNNISVEVYSLQRTQCYQGGARRWILDLPVYPGWRIALTRERPLVMLLEGTSMRPNRIHLLEEPPKCSRSRCSKP